MHLPHLEHLDPVRARRVRAATAWLLALSAGLQLALALVFAPAHRWGGIAAALLALAFLVTTLRAHLDRTTRTLSVALSLLVWLQGLLVALMRTTTVAGPLHSVNGFLILGLSLLLALDAESDGRA